MTMCSDINKSLVESQEKMDGVKPHQPIGGISQSERTVVLSILADLAKAGLGVLDEIPGRGGEFFTLHSGEMFWLEANEITRMR